MLGKGKIKASNKIYYPHKFTSYARGAAKYFSLSSSLNSSLLQQMFEETFKCGEKKIDEISRVERISE